MTDSAGWISVKHQLPPDNNPVLACFVRTQGDGSIQIIRAVYARRFTLVAMEDFEGCEWKEEGDPGWETDMEGYCPEGWYEWNEWENTHWKVHEEVGFWKSVGPPPDEYAADAVEKTLGGK